MYINFIYNNLLQHPYFFAYLNYKILPHKKTIRLIIKTIKRTKPCKPGSQGY